VIGPRYLGVDPGGTGALALLDADGRLLAVEDMPVHEGVVSAPLAANIVEGWKDALYSLTAWVEDVHSMPKQGVSSSFKFGRAFGTIVGVLGGAMVPVEYVTPAKWKQAARLSKDKNASRRRAVELWPEHADLFKRVKDDGRAEAALIARHGWLARREVAA
jgi:crossover junction endodeoxyribonuclease RuvC